MLCLHFLLVAFSCPKTRNNLRSIYFKSKRKKLKQYINSHLSKAANIAFSKNGLVYFTELAEETVKKMRLNLFSEPEIFASLPEWISPADNTEPRAEGLRVDDRGRVLIAESGTGKLLRMTPDARKLEVLADSYDGYRFTTVKDLAIGQGDDLFVSSPFSATVYRIRPRGFVGILNDDLVRVEGICISPDGKRLLQPS